MRHTKPYLLRMLGMAVLSCILTGQDTVVERVEVTNRELVVRVFDGGEPVAGLTRGDFRLLENKATMQITSCREVWRALVPRQPAEPKEPESARTQTRSRLFLFLLWWNEESPDWPQAWKYFKKQIFRPGDRVILASDRHSLEIKDPDREKAELAAFFAQVTADLKQKKAVKISMIRHLNSYARDFHENLALLAAGQLKTPLIVLINRFQNQYRGVLEEYRLQRLHAQPQMMQRLATALRAVNVEKWALLFLQNERLPLLHRNSRLFTETYLSLETNQTMKRFVQDCDRRMRMATDMSTDVLDLRSMFIGAGATFHLFLSDAAAELEDSDYLRWFPLFSSWESAFREIARDTGGDVQDTTRLRQALEEAAARRDIYYVLTYKPKAPGTGKPQIQVQVNRPGLKAVYARRLRPREIRPLMMTAPLWQNGALRFQISDYLRETGETGNPVGDVHISVQTETRAGKTLNFKKIIRPAGESVQVEMGVNFPGPGDYMLAVAVRDRISGNTARGYTRATIAAAVPQPRIPMDPRLQVMLDRAALYCRKLQRAAFHFTCNEAVKEKILERNPLSKRVEPVENHWRYDYQVVADQGEVVEQRILVQRGQKMVDQPGAKLETRFKAQYSVFLPVTLLGERNRENYRFKMLDSRRLKKCHCAVIEVTPRLEGQGPLARGRVWMDVDDGSILKIEMYPRGVSGSAALEAAAKEMSAQLDLNVVHWYLEKRRGLRFPSSAEFSESYVFDKQVVKRKSRVYQPFALQGESHAVLQPTVESGRRRVNFYRLTQEYEKYRYFEVTSRVEVDKP